MAWDTACRDWEERLLSGSSLVPELPLYSEEAEKAIRIFKRLRLPDVIGNPTMEEACGEWVYPIIAALFGSYNTATNRREIQEIFLLVPKKNAKSTFAAAIMVTALIMNRRPAAEALLIAPTKEIADISFKQATGIIALDPELKKIFHPQRHIRLVTHRLSGAMLQIKAADTDTITGSKSTYILIDETHVFSKKTGASDVFVEIRGALAARPDGFMMQITTQSKDPPSGVFKTELATARDVRDGVVKLPLLAVLYELPRRLAENNGWKNEKYWPLVNPNMGRSVDETFLLNALIKAEREGDEQLRLLASQHHNVEVGMALRNDQWIGAKYWKGAADKTLTLDTLIERSEVVTVGVDGGGLDDLFGLAVCGRCKVTRDWLFWFRAWAQPDVLERRKDIATKLLDFKAAGDLVICETPTQDYTEVADIVERLKDEGLLPTEFAIGLDPIGVAAVVDELSLRDIGGNQVSGISQGYKLSSAIWGFERKLKDVTLWHSGSEMMDWCVSNAKAEQRGNAVLITKATAGKAKIDPLVAGFNAFMLMARNPMGVEPSPWENPTFKVEML